MPIWGPIPTLIDIHHLFTARPIQVGSPKYPGGDFERQVHPGGKFWKESAHRHERQIVCKPGGTTRPNEFNLWRVFGVAPRQTRRRIASLLRHIWKVLCRKDKTKFKYLIRWLAWAVQNPDKLPGTIVVLKSLMQGTGKSIQGAPAHAPARLRLWLANKGHDTRALQAYLGHCNIQHAVRYTELSPTRFKDFWRK